MVAYLRLLGCGAIWGVSICPQTLGLSQYRKFLANYLPEGQEEPFSEHVTQLKQKVLQDTGVSSAAERCMEFFTCYGVDPLHRGSCKVPTGAIIGIPHTFSYKTEADVNKNLFRLRPSEYGDLKYVDWESEYGQKFLDSLVLSDQAKQFGIAREIHYAGTSSVQVDAVLKLGFGALTVGMANIGNQRLALRERALRSTRVGIYTILGVAALSLYLMVSDAYCCACDNKADRAAALISHQYAEGAVEFYQKQVQRNIALRALMGAKGADLFTPFGNEMTSMRQPQVKVTSRLENVRRIREHFRSASSPPSDA